MNLIKNKLIIILTLLIISASNAYTQTRALVSPNSRFFAIEEFNGKKLEGGIKVYEYEYKIYHLQSKSFLHSFILQSKSEVQPNVVKFSPDGKTFCAKQLQIETHIQIKGGIEKKETKHHILKIWDVRSGKLIKEEIGYDDLLPVFFNQSHYFLLISKNEMSSYETHNGKKIMDYKFVRNTQVKKAFVSSDDKYIVVSNTRGQSMVWQVGNSKMRKRITGEDLKFSRNMKFLTAYRAAGPNIFTYVYKIPSFHRAKNINAGKVLRDLTKKERAQIKKENPDLKSVILPTYKIIPTKSNFGPYGKYIVAYAYRNFKETEMQPGMQERKLVFIEPLTGKAIYEISETNDELSLSPYNWAGNNIFLVQTDSFNVDVLNLKAEQFVQNLELNFNYESGEKALNEKKQLKLRIVSENKRYVIIPVVGSEKDFYVKCTYLDQPKTLVKNLQFVGFSPNSRHMFVKTDSGKVAVINTINFEKTAGKSIDYNELKNLPDSLKNTELSIIQQFKAGEQGKEDLVEEDSNEPDGYEYIRAGNLREIESIEKGDIVNLYLKTIEMYNDKLGIQLHLMDYYGNLIAGAGSEAWKKLWCNVIVESPDGKVTQIDDFEITEYSAKDSIATAIAIVMDHSGSMGNDRARMLQDGALHFIKNKRKEDAVALVKYDHAIGVEAELTTDRKKLAKQLNMNGLGRFGGGTSLIDGINEGISLVNNASGYQRKAVIVLTDGNENSSYLTKNEVVVRAIREGINIHVVGFGEYINQPYLVGIANHTEGSYFQIYDRRDFKWVFTDIYQKIKNYYSIRFDAELLGNYKVIIELCPENAEAEKLATEFDFSPIDISKVSLYFDAKDAFEKNTSKFDMGILEDIKYQIEPLTNFDKITIKNPVGELISTQVDTNAIDIVQVEEEFQSIVFPDINFEYNDVVIVEGTANGLEDVVEFLKKNPTIVIEISGHTDDVGDPAENQKLSERRAINVKKKLLSLGAESQQIETVGYGDTMPLNGDYSNENNRRVEFKIVNYDK